MELKDKIIEDKQKYWDTCADLYDKRIQAISFQPYVTLLTHTEAYKCDRVLELAIGTGTHTLFFAKTLLKNGGTMVCTEISPKMLEIAESKFNDPDNEFILSSKNKVYFQHDENLLDGQ